jgi:hypothetical protein
MSARLDEDFLRSPAGGAFKARVSAALVVPLRHPTRRAPQNQAVAVLRVHDEGW